MSKKQIVSFSFRGIATFFVLWALHSQFTGKQPNFTIALLVVFGGLLLRVEPPYQTRMKNWILAVVILLALFAGAIGMAWLVLKFPILFPAMLATLFLIACTLAVRILKAALDDYTKPKP